MNDRSSEIIAIEAHLGSISLLDEIEQEQIFKLLIKIFSNILSDPNNTKYHDINVIKMCKKIRQSTQFIELLCDSGFCRSHVFGERLLFDIKHLNKLKSMNDYLMQYIKKKSVLNKNTNSNKLLKQSEPAHYPIQSVDNENIIRRNKFSNVKLFPFQFANYKSSFKKKLLSFGYVRKEYIHIVNCIPVAIIKLISIFIDLVDTWDRNNSSCKILISYKHLNINNNENDNDNNQIRQFIECSKTSVNRNWHHAFGTNIIQYGQIAAWTLKMSSKNAQIIIGIIDNKLVSQYVKTFVGKNGFGYGLSSINYELLHNQDEGRVWSKRRFLSMAANDVIKVELDMNNKKSKGILKYNGVMAWDNVDIKRQYRLCVAFCNSHDKIEIALVDSM